MAQPYKVRHKRDGTTELIFDCDLCGSPKNLEINPQKGVWKCWACQRAGRVPEGALRDLGVDPTITALPVPTLSPPVEPERLGPLPPEARAAIEARGLDPDWCEHRYGARWDGDRICWPAGKGWVRRAIYPWQTPKTMTVPPHGLVGEHLLVPGCHAVITEGDYKAAAIPVPWVGLGLLGTSITQEQAQTLLVAGCASITVLLDGGYHREARSVLRLLMPSVVRVLDLPEGKGPDDIERHELVALLLGRN